MKEMPVSYGANDTIYRYEAVAYDPNNPDAPTGHWIPVSTDPNYQYIKGRDLDVGVNDAFGGSEWLKVPVEKPKPIQGPTAQSSYDYTWGLGMLPPIPKTETVTNGTGGGGGGEPPKQDKRTRTRVPGTSTELLSMPDLDKAVSDEIQRLTLSIIEDGKDLMLSKEFNYNSIKYLPDVEIQIIPPQKKINFVRDKFNDLIKTINRKISKSIIGNSTNYNYEEYLDLFEVQYNNSDGKPILKFKIDLDDFNLTDFSIINLRRIG